MLWYLHLCAAAGVTVVSYADAAAGEMAMHKDGSGEFVKVTLRPRIELAPGSDADKAHALHGEVHKFCFIARSVNFPVSGRAANCLRSAVISLQLAGRWAIFPPAAPRPPTGLPCMKRSAHESR